MDPNATLERLRKLVTKLQGSELMTHSELIELTDEMSELIKALDDWLAAGGFLPKRWERRTR